MLAVIKKIIDSAILGILILGIIGCQMPSYQTGGMPSLPGGSTTISPPSSSQPSGSQSPSTGTQAPSGGQPGMPDSSKESPIPGGDGGESMEDLDGALDDSLDGFDDTLAEKSGDTRIDEIDILSPAGGSSLEDDDEIGPLSDADVIVVENQDYDMEAQSGAKLETNDGKMTQAAIEGIPGEGSETSKSAAVPEDIGDGQGDDIVLRQIREAAMKERNPVLRDKLWDEYRKIKGI